jgi:TonB-linked SusC/RagA family outer membrane protein
VLCTIFVSSVYSQAADQPILLKGVVIDKRTNEGIPGASIVIDGTYMGTVADANGNFSIRTSKGKVLVFSSIGYTSQKIKVEQTYLKVKLAVQVESLDEVKVTARTNINDIDMRKMAGDIEVVKMSKLAIRPETDLTMLLQGQVPGLMVTPTGELGTKPKVRIRGTSSFREGDLANEPLYVLDGMVISAEAFHTLNAEDFEEIKVLKDAAASALYGIKAANGVVEITSKRGFEGKAQFTYRTKMGLTLRGPRGVEMMDSEEKLELERLLQLDHTPGYRYSEEYYRRNYSGASNLDELIAQGQRKLDSLRTINTDWFKELIKTNIYQSHSLGVRGGTKTNKYYYSLKYDRQGGRIEGNDLNRITGRMNLDYSLAQSLHLSFNTSLGYSKTDTPYGSEHNPTSLVYDLNPYEQKVDPATGKPVELDSYPNRTFHDLMNQYNSESTSKRINSSLNMNWEITKGLDLSAVTGFDYLLREKLSKVPREAFSQTGFSDAEKGEITKEKNTELNYSTNIRLNYNKEWNKHNVTLSTNYDYYYTGYDNIGLKGYGIASKVNTAAGINQGLAGNRQTKVSSRKEKSAQLGIGFALGYSFNSMYDFYGSYKTDASSLLPSDKRWNTAWSAGIGWEIGNYELFKDWRALTALRLRASYGYTASLAGVPASASVPTYSYSDEIYSQSRIIDLNQFYNKNLKPEQSKSYNVGMNIKLFDLFNFDISAYKRITEDALLEVSIPASNGYSTMNRNIGILQNSGLEFRISGNLINKDELRWNSSLSLSWNRNKVVELYEGDVYFIGDGEKIIPDYKEGEPLDLIYGLESLGIHSIDGLPRFLSATGEQVDYKHKFTLKDFKVLGYSTAPYMGFFNNMIRYKSLSLNFDFYYSFGGIAKYDQKTYVRDSDFAHKNAVKGQTKDMWFKPGDENKTYRTANEPNAAWDILDQPTTKTVYKTDYIKLSNISLNYRLPASMLKKTNGLLKYASLSVQAQNIWKYRKEKDKASLSGVEQPILTIGANLTF